jgi:hypothetical protein
MDSLFHFIFPLIALLAAHVKFRKHRLVTVLGLAVAAVLIDMDVFFGSLHRALFHNIFVTVAFPLVLVFLSFRYGLERHRQTSIALLIVLSSHLILDLFSEGIVYMLYPLSLQGFSLASVSMLPGYGYFLSTSSIGLLIYFAMLSGCFFLEDIDFFILKKHLSFRYALKYALKKEEEKLLG